MTSVLRNAHILLVEDQAQWVASLLPPLKKRHAEVTHVQDKAQAISRLYAEEYDAVLLDSGLFENAFAGVEILEMHKAAILPNGRPRPPMVMVTQINDVELLLRAQHARVDEFLPKKNTDNYGDLVAAVLEKWVEHGRWARAVGGGLVLESASMLAIYDRLKAQAGSDQLVLLTGETGVGKNELAKLIHKLHPRRNKKPLAEVVCPTIPPYLFESELFGTREGAYNDAINRKGQVKLADGGVLFLDEIGELSGDHQARLLRFIETHEFRPVGGEQSEKTDVKIIAATNVDLEERVNDGRFRQDLYYRLTLGMHILIPPLRERLEDIDALADRYRLKANHELRKSVRGFKGDVLAVLRARPWIGNIRELESVVKRAVERDQDQMISVDDLPAFTADDSSTRAISKPTELERKLRALVDSEGEPSALYEVMKQMMRRGPKNFLMPKEAASKATMRAAIMYLRGHGESARAIADQLSVQEQTIRNAMNAHLGVAQ